MSDTISEIGDIFTKWILLFEISPDDRSQLYHSLHDDITAGFSLISELGWTLCSSPECEQARPAITEQLAFTVWGGYMLFLLEHAIDPVTQNIKLVTYTPSLLDTWKAAYEKNQAEEYRLGIPWITSLLLNTATSIRMDRLSASVDAIGTQSYRDALQLRDALGWAGINGYCLAMIEDRQRKSHGTA